MRPFDRSWRPLGATLATVALILVACTPGDRGDFTQKTGKLEVVSWWTSGSESKALAALFDAFAKAEPGVRVESAAIQGGAGSNVQIALAKRLRDNDPPDLWQTFAGASLRAYAQDERIADVSAVFEKDGLAQAIPTAVLDALTWNGKRWGVPTGAHRQNLLWFNPAALTKAGVAPPASGYTMERFSADLAALKAKGLSPLCLGAKDRFTTTELFENILLGTIGVKGWADITADRFAWNGRDVRKSLDRLGQILDYADASTSLSWDEAAKQLAGGRCAFLSMNDSLYGELTAAGVAASDIGYTAFPGTEDSYVAILDTFVAARGARNGYNALQFLDAIGTAPTEVAFAKLKGSVPLRKDADVSALPAYQQAAYRAMSEGTILLSITHGELLSPRFQQAVYDGVAAFARSRNPKAFTDRIQQAVSGVASTGY